MCTWKDQDRQGEQRQHYHGYAQETRSYFDRLGPFVDQNMLDTLFIDGSPKNRCIVFEQGNFIEDNFAQVHGYEYML